MKIWFTLTGTNHYLGNAFLEKGLKVRLEKEPDNRFDREAIKVTVKGLGHVGYVANSPYTVVGESWSAGRLYDKIGDTAKAKVTLVTEKGALCRLDTEKNQAPGKPGEKEEPDRTEPGREKTVRPRPARTGPAEK